MSDKIRLAVIFGGQSSEHEVSRASAQSVLENIDKSKYDIVKIGITRDGRWLRYDGPAELIGSGEWQKAAEEKALLDGCFPKNGPGESTKAGVDGEDASSLQLNTARSIISCGGSSGAGIDVVFPVLHGCNGEDGTIQGLFELAGIPYVGPGVLGSALGMDKAYAKIVFEKAGIPQGDYQFFTRKEIRDSMEYVVSEIEKGFSYPCFVKPSNAGSSVGVSKVHDREELKAALVYAARYDRKVLVEEFIDGREIECAVLGNDNPVASTVGEVVPCSEFYDYKAKYASESNSQVIIPADLPEETIEKVRQYAVRAFKALDCCGLSRVDFFVHRKTGEVYINEINTLPGFTSISMYPKLWEASGIPYSQLIDRLIELAIERYGDNKKAIE